MVNGSWYFGVLDEHGSPHFSSIRIFKSPPQLIGSAPPYAKSTNETRLWAHPVGQLPDTLWFLHSFNWSFFAMRRHHPEYGQVQEQKLLRRGSGAQSHEENREPCAEVEYPQRYAGPSGMLVDHKVGRGQKVRQNVHHRKKGEDTVAEHRESASDEALAEHRHLALRQPFPAGLFVDRRASLITGLLRVLHHAPDCRTDFDAASPGCVGGGVRLKRVSTCFAH